MKLPLAVTTVAATVLACGCALAQVGAPVGPSAGPSVGLGTPIGPVGIPLGAMELAAPGLSPPGTNTMGCPSATTPGAPSAAPVFDGGGMAGAVPSGCAPGGSGSMAPSPSETTPPALRAGRAGIPLGSTEIGSPGLSPLPPLTTLVTPTPSAVVPGASSTAPMAGPPAALEPPCPLVGTFTSQSTVQAARSSATSGTAPSPGC